MARKRTAPKSVGPWDRWINRAKVLHEEVEAHESVNYCRPEMEDLLHALRRFLWICKDLFLAFRPDHGKVRSVTEVANLWRVSHNAIYIRAAEAGRTMSQFRAAQDLDQLLENNEELQKLEKSLLIALALKERRDIADAVLSRCDWPQLRKVLRATSIEDLVS